MERFEIIGNIRDSQNKKLGNCFVTRKHVYTCLHVLSGSTEHPFHVFLPQCSMLIPLNGIVPEIYDNEDVAIFQLEKEAFASDLYHPTLVNRRNFRGLPVEVYLDGGRKCWVKCTIHDFAPNGLNAEQTPCENLIVEGDSGSPVWHDDQIIGVVKQIKGRTSVALQPFNQDIIKNKAYSTFEFKHFPLPKGYVRRDDLFLKVRELLDEDPPRPVVLCGLSGVGKTELSRDLGNQYKKSVFISRGMDDLDSRKQELSDCDLLIIDNYTYDPGLNAFITACHCRLVISVSSPAAKDQLDVLLPNNEKVNVEEFSDTESQIFLANVQDYDIKQRIILYTRNPLLLRLFLEAYKKRELLRIDLRHSLTHNQSNVEVSLMEQWFDLICDGRETLRSILMLLCISHRGLDLQSIASILDENPVTIERFLSKLQERGFILIDRIDPLQLTTIYLHEKLKYLLNQMEITHRDVMADLYFQFLKSPKAAKTPLFTRVDALVSSMKNLWEQLANRTLSGPDFLKKSQEFSERLSVLLPSNAVSEEEARWVQEKFGDCISGHCTEIIPIASIVSQFPAQPIFGSTLYHGAINNIWDHEKASDTARAHLIFSAVHHWIPLNKEEKTARAKMLGRYLRQDVISLKSGNAIDTEVASILGGMCTLGGSDLAVEVVTSKEYENAYFRSDVGLLTLLSGLLLDDLKKERTEVIESIIERYSKIISESQAKDDMKAYLRLKLLKDIPFERSEHECRKYYIGNGEEVEADSLSRTVSIASRNKEYDEFLEKRGRHYSMLG